MNKNGNQQPKYLIQLETFSKNLLKNVSSLMEHQSLVDVVVCCGSNSIQAHKLVLAANSPLFREEFEKNPLIEQVIVSGCDFAILKSVIELMYCGQTMINEENMKYLVAMVKLFQMKHLENVFIKHTGSNEEIFLPKPQFLTKKPKYPAFTYQLANPPTATVVQPPKTNVLKPLDLNVPTTTINKPLPARTKRNLNQQAEQACVKEAQASRMALVSLQKEIRQTPQVSSFIIEDTCTETTVENFIPNSQNSFVQLVNLNDMQENLQNAMVLPVSMVSEHDGLKVVPFEKPDPIIAGKIKSLFGGESDVEIMFRDAAGNYMPVNEKILQNLTTKDGIQYQIVDEEGNVSDLQELDSIEKLDKVMDAQMEVVDLRKPIVEIGDYLNEAGTQLNIKENVCSILPVSMETAPITKETVEKSPEIIQFPSDMFFSDIICELETENIIREDDGDQFIESQT